MDDLDGGSLHREATNTATPVHRLGLEPLPDGPHPPPQVGPVPDGVIEKGVHPRPHDTTTIRFIGQ
ncbi:hypothetical protein NG819_15690 [Pseudarthrobacter sp. Fe7]|nr:hypothetical protein NG819_15690 [Pseudarthrobacter sp. Fe7]